MPQPRFSKPAPAHAWLRSNILGLVAIFIALSGTAFAAQSVTTDGATKAAKKKAKPGPRGPAGPAGAAGATGAQGAQGVAGPVALHIQRSTLSSVSAGAFSNARADCPLPQIPTGGGVLNEPAGTTALGMAVMFSGPVDTNRDVETTLPDAWFVEYENGSGAGRNIQAFVVCTTPTSATIATG